MKELNMASGIGPTHVGLRMGGHLGGAARYGNGTQENFRPSTHSKIWEPMVYGHGHGAGDGQLSMANGRGIGIKACSGHEPMHAHQKFERHLKCSEKTTRSLAIFHPRPS